MKCAMWNLKSCNTSELQKKIGPPKKVRYLFIDKIHTLKQHRDDVVTAATRQSGVKHTKRWWREEGYISCLILGGPSQICLAVLVSYVVVDLYYIMIEQWKNKWWKWCNTLLFFCNHHCISCMWFAIIAIMMMMTILILMTYLRLIEAHTTQHYHWIILTKTNSCTYQHATSTYTWQSITRKEQEHVI